MGVEIEEGKVIGIFSRVPVKIDPSTDEANALRAEAIESLEEILADLRLGHLNGFAMVFTCADGGLGSLTSSEVQYIPIEYLGALDRLKHRINQMIDYEEEGGHED